MTLLLVVVILTGTRKGCLATIWQLWLWMQGLTPLLGIDMWEHAFYLQYKNVKPDYLNAIWDVINWREVARRYEEAATK